MQASQFQFIGTILLIVQEAIGHGKSSPTLFWRTFGIKLNATVTAKVDGIAATDCIAVCLKSEKCKSFNAFDANGPFLPRCEFFAHDKCSTGTALVKDSVVSYFDTRGDAKCPLSE